MSLLLSSSSSSLSLFAVCWFAFGVVVDFWFVRLFWFFVFFVCLLFVCWFVSCLIFVGFRAAIFLWVWLLDAAGFHTTSSNKLVLVVVFWIS